MWWLISKDDISTHTHTHACMHGHNYAMVCTSCLTVTQLRDCVSDEFRCRMECAWELDTYGVPFV